MSLTARERADVVLLLQEWNRRQAARCAADPKLAKLANIERYCPHRPTGKQSEFLGVDAKEALYGGAAGGGKSDALLMAALQYVHVPGYSAILFRRTYQDLSLPDALIPRSHEWFSGTDARWDRETHTWIFPSGAKIAFGYCDSLGDEYRYQGAAFQFIGWDELTQFEEAVYIYLFSRLRTVQGVNVPLRVRGATNPGGIGHRWVKRRFIDPETKEAAAIYVPAKVSDNPHLRDDYAESLAYLDATLRERYLNGDWSVVEDNVFVFPFERSRHLAEAPIPVEQKEPFFRTVVGGIDPGTRDPYAVGVWGLDWDGNWWGLDELYLLGATTTSMASAIRQLAEKWGVKAWFCDKRKLSDIIDLGKCGVANVSANLDVHYETERDTIRPMLGVCVDLMRAGKLKFSRRMRWHIQEAEAYRYKDAEAKNAGEVPLDKDNHAMDAMRYAICSVAEGAIPGVESWRPRGAKRTPDRKPGYLVRIPTAVEYLRQHDRAEEKILRSRPGGMRIGR